MSKEEMIPAEDEITAAYDRIEELEREVAELISALELTQPGSEFAQCLPDNWSLAAAKAYEQMQTILFKWRKP